MYDNLEVSLRLSRVIVRFSVPIRPRANVSPKIASNLFVLAGTGTAQLASRLYLASIAAHRASASAYRAFAAAHSAFSFSSPPTVA